MKGKVRFFKDFNGYGFATGDDGNDYFLHVSEICSPGFRTLDEGQEIDFAPSRNRRGLFAREIIPMGRLDIRDIDARQPENQPTIIKNNPFTPQDPISDPRKFVGRKDSILNAIDSLFNGKNILIAGHRGIGKSSLALQLLYATEGEIELLDRFGIKLTSQFNNVTGDHRCLADNDLGDIVNGLITTLNINLGKFVQLKNIQTSLSVDAKVATFKHQIETEPLSPSDLSVWFVALSKQLLREYAYEAQGITFLIDEIDVLGDKVDLASFLKATTEKFRLDSYFSVNFIVSGVTGTATKLILQHPSSERLFEHLDLPRMSAEELMAIIDAALIDTGVTIEETVKKRIARLSNEFPHPTHLLGYHSFRFDTDNIINNVDVEKAIRFITTSLRRQHFQSKFYSIREGTQSEIIRAMAAAPYETVNIAYLLQGLPPMVEAQIIGPMDYLIDELEIIEKSGKGQYRFRDPLFKVYLRMLFRIGR